MTGDEDRLHAQPDFTEWACLLHKREREASQLIETLRPLVDGLYEGEAPGVAHNFLELKRETIVLADMAELVSLLVPHEAAVRALAAR
jgi:hypothetical protein